MVSVHRHAAKELGVWLTEMCALSFRQVDHAIDLAMLSRYMDLLQTLAAAPPRFPRLPPYVAENLLAAVLNDDLGYQHACVIFHAIAGEHGFLQVPVLTDEELEHWFVHASTTSDFLRLTTHAQHVRMLQRFDILARWGQQNPYVGYAKSLLETMEARIHSHVEGFEEGGSAPDSPLVSPRRRRRTSQ